MNKIRETDVISGRLYLKLLNDYKEYDKKQKEIIFQLKQTIKNLNDTINSMQPINENDRKFFNQAELIVNLQRKNHQLKIRNQQLIEENQRLALKL